LVDGGVLRLALDPALAHDVSLAGRVVRDVERAGIATVEAPGGSAIRAELVAAGWAPGDPWTPLSRDLREAVEEPSLSIVSVDESSVDARVAVQRAAFEGSTFTRERWFAMAAGPAFAAARCLLGLDGDGVAVAAATVWSAGNGRPGLIEPLGVHRDHRGRGHGTAITLASAAALRDLGASSAIVATPEANAPAVATYEAAGFQRRASINDLTRPAR
jgi:ribosomal protein S18 acetylase RimI-like enzyme